MHPRGSGVEPRESGALVSVVMPAYRLEGVIAHVVDAVKRVMEGSGYNYEIIVVDDGSPDKTYLKAREAADSAVHVYRIARNTGKGYALILGYRASKGNYVVFFDADLDVDPRQIILLIKAIEITGADAAITSKWHPSSRTNAPYIRKFLSKSFNALVRLLLGLPVSDTQTGAKAFKRRVLDDVTKYLTVKRYAFDVELLTAIVARGYRVAEVPALWRITLKPKFSLREIWRMLIDLLAITYRHRLNKQYTRAQGLGLGHSEPYSS